VIVSTRDYEIVALHDLVEFFSTKMKDRLQLLYEKGASGWDDKDEDYDYFGRIDYHIDKYMETGNATHLIDVANLVMFVYNKEIA
jgi:hypothetical protein